MATYCEAWAMGRGAYHSRAMEARAKEEYIIRHLREGRVVMVGRRKLTQSDLHHICATPEGLLLWRDGQVSCLDRRRIRVFEAAEQLGNQERGARNDLP